MFKASLSNGEFTDTFVFKTEEGLKGFKQAYDALREWSTNGYKLEDVELATGDDVELIQLDDPK